MQQTRCQVRIARVPVRTVGNSSPEGTCCEIGNKRHPPNVFSREWHIDCSKIRATLEHRFCKKFMTQGRSNELQYRRFEPPTATRAAEIGGPFRPGLPTSGPTNTLCGAGGYCPSLDPPCH